VSVAEIKVAIETVKKRTARRTESTIAKEMITPPTTMEKVQLQTAERQRTVAPGDSALLGFTAQVLELLRRINKRYADRFAATAISADECAKLARFFADLAQLKRTAR
jgi:hypothetical protein